MGTIRHDVTTPLAVIMYLASSIVIMIAAARLLGLY
jgi:hypothetical protein